MFTSSKEECLKISCGKHLYYIYVSATVFHKVKKLKLLEDTKLGINRIEVGLEDEPKVKSPQYIIHECLMYFP